MDTTITGAGINSNIEAQVDSTHASLRANLKPLEHVANGVIGGHYKMTASYSSTAAKPAAGSDIFSLRWTDTRYFFILKRLAVWAVTTTAYTASANEDFALFMARSFTVSPSAGTQIIPLAGGQAMRGQNMKKSGLDGTSGVLWVSSGDLLTTGTRTLDTQPIGYSAWLNAITPINAPSTFDLYQNRDFGEHPVVLTANEGLVIQTPIGNAQAAGVTKYTFAMDWAEVPAY